MQLASESHTFGRTSGNQIPTQLYPSQSLHRGNLPYSDYPYQNYGHSIRNVSSYHVPGSPQHGYLGHSTQAYPQPKYPYQQDGYYGLNAGQSHYQQKHGLPSHIVNHGYEYNNDAKYLNHRALRHQSHGRYSNFNPQYERQQGRSHLRREGAPYPMNRSLQKRPMVTEVVYEQQPLNIPQPVKNIQFIPHLNRYMDYVEQRVKVPVQKYYTDYYEIQHVTDFVPREYEDSVVQMVPEQIVRYRLQYVPVQRKIVHLPKNQVYDQNGLYKGVGQLADRVHINEAALGIFDEANKSDTQINRNIHRNLSNSQISRSDMRGLQESLVQGISKQMQNMKGNQSLINQPIYEGIKGSIDPSKQPASNINQNVYQGISKAMGGASINESLPQNQMINQQIFQSLSRNISAQNGRSRTGPSRKRTSYVTSDGYFPNYQEEMKNTSFYEPPRDYFNQNYAQNTADRRLPSDINRESVRQQLAYKLANISASRNSYGEY